MDRMLSAVKETLVPAEPPRGPPETGRSPEMSSVFLQRGENSCWELASPREDSRLDPLQAIPEKSRPGLSPLVKGHTKVHAL